MFHRHTIATLQSVYPTLQEEEFPVQEIIFVTENWFFIEKKFQNYMAKFQRWKTKPSLLGKDNQKDLPSLNNLETIKVHIVLRLPL